MMYSFVCHYVVCHNVVCRNVVCYTSVISLSPSFSILSPPSPFLYLSPSATTKTPTPPLSLSFSLSVSLSLSLSLSFSLSLSRAHESFYCAALSLSMSHLRIPLCMQTPGSIPNPLPSLPQCWNPGSFLTAPASQHMDQRMGGSCAPGSDFVLDQGHLSFLLPHFHTVSTSHL